MRPRRTPALAGSALGAGAIAASANKLMWSMGQASEPFPLSVSNAVLSTFPASLPDMSAWAAEPSALAATAGVGALAFGMIAACTLGKRPKAYRPGEEHGSARWGTREDAEPYADAQDPCNNIILSATERIVLAPRRFDIRTDCNKNVCVIGAPGTGKTRYIVKPNLMQLNSSYLVTDPKATLLPETGQMFVDAGYALKIVNLIDLARSMRYNPLAYVSDPVACGDGKCQTDISRMVNVLMKNTNGSGEQAKEDFWAKAERNLFRAVIGYLMYAANPEDRTFASLIDLVDLARCKEEDDDYMSPLDHMFRKFETGEAWSDEAKCFVRDPSLEPHPNHYCCRMYRKFKLGAGKTMKSILISVASRLSDFDNDELREMMSSDELELDAFGEKKCALFLQTPDSDSTFAFVTSMLLYQFFQLNKVKADTEYRAQGGRLPVPIQCYLDEFGTIGKIHDFEFLINTLRSRGISVVIILQSYGQLALNYEEHAQDAIVDGCDTMVFLGGKSQKTTKMISEGIGNMTVTHDAQSKTYSVNDSSGISEQLIQRALIDAAEVAKLPPDECIVRLKAADFKSKKYDLERHPRYSLIDPGHAPVRREKARYSSPFDEDGFIRRYREERDLPMAG